MPLHLEPIDVIDDLGESQAVLIVSCPVCGPVSVAMQQDAPWIEFLRHGVKADAFERHVRSLREELERRGIRSAALTMYTPSPMMCVWTQGQRTRLRRRAEGYDAVVVMGCDSARISVERALAGTGLRVVVAMEMTGLTNARMSFERPFTVRLDEKALVGDDGFVTEMDSPPGP